ncbi:MAG: hypothetical protein ACRD3W_16535 [Terriglobales bacterium]
MSFSQAADAVAGVDIPIEVNFKPSLQFIERRAMMKDELLDPILDDDGLLRRWPLKVFVRDKLARPQCTGQLRLRNIQAT